MNFPVNQGCWLRIWCRKKSQKFIARDIPRGWRCQMGGRHLWAQLVARSETPICMYTCFALLGVVCGVRACVRPKFVVATVGAGRCGRQTCRIADFVIGGPQYVEPRPLIRSKSKKRRSLHGVLLCLHFILGLDFRRFRLKIGHARSEFHWHESMNIRSASRLINLRIRGRNSGRE